MQKRPLMIQGALQSEIETLLKIFSPYRKSQVGGFVFYECEYRGYPVVIAKTKMGEIAAAISTTLAIERYCPAWIVNQGTAGALTENHRTGDLIVGTSVRYFSQYATAEDRDRDCLNPWKSDGYRTVDGEVLSLDTNDAFLKWITSLAPDFEGQVTFDVLGSGDVWSKTKDEIAYRHGCTGAVSESMECTGAYMAANSLGVPLVSVRVVSNNELLGEVYDPDSGKIAQRFARLLVDAWIDLGENTPF